MGEEHKTWWGKEERKEKQRQMKRTKEMEFNDHHMQREEGCKGMEDLVKILINLIVTFRWEI